MHKRGFAVVELLVGAIVIGAIAAGVYLYFINNQTVDTETEPTPISTPSPIPTVTLSSTPTP